MEFSLMTYTVQATQPGGLKTLEEIADLAVEVGCGALELSAHNLGDRSVAEFRAICAERELAVSCVNGAANLVAEDPAIFAAGLDQARSYLTVAHQLDCPTVMIVPFPAASEADKPRALERMAEGLRLLLCEAQPLGITVTVEDFPNPLTPCCSIADVQRLMELVPGLMLTYDNGNWIIAGDDPVEAALAFAGRIANAHIKDWEPAPERAGKQVPDGRWLRGGLHGQGIIDHAAVFSALRRVSYDGWLAFEYEGPLDHVQATREGLSYLRQVLTRSN